MYNSTREEWKDIESFPLYEISSYGNVIHKERPTILRKISINLQGFPIVVLYGPDKKTRYPRQINKLVAQTFLPPPLYENETAVWHIDGDLLNCHVSNLKWDTRPRVLEWNNMHRVGRPSYPTPRVKNNRTGVIYENAYECAMEEGQLESTIVFKVERQARHLEDDHARYRYIFEGTYVE